MRCGRTPLSTHSGRTWRKLPVFCFRLFGCNAVNGFGKSWGLDLCAHPCGVACKLHLDTSSTLLDGKVTTALAQRVRSWSPCKLPSWLRLGKPGTRGKLFCLVVLFWSVRGPCWNSESFMRAQLLSLLRLDGLCPMHSLSHPRSHASLVVANRNASSSGSARGSDGRYLRRQLRRSPAPCAGRPLALASRRRRGSAHMKEVIHTVFVGQRFGR